jgi:hypothetical protein
MIDVRKATPPDIFYRGAAAERQGEVVFLPAGSTIRLAIADEDA